MNAVAKNSFNMMCERPLRLGGSLCQGESHCPPDTGGQTGAKWAGAH